MSKVKDTDMEKIIMDNYSSELHSHKSLKVKVLSLRHRLR